LINLKYICITYSNITANDVPNNCKIYL
jgi:hypothetical protein